MGWSTAENEACAFVESNDCMHWVLAIRTEFAVFTDPLKLVFLLDL